jgi:hypothetical protein
LKKPSQYFMTGGIYKKKSTESTVGAENVNKNLSLELRLSKPIDLEALQEYVHLYYSFKNFFLTLLFKGKD